MGPGWVYGSTRKFRNWTELVLATRREYAKYHGPVSLKWFNGHYMRITLFFFKKGCLPQSAL